MANLNKVMLIGRLTRDPEVRTFANGGKVDVDGGRVGGYATWFDRGLHLDAAVSGGPNSYRTRRTTPNNTVATGGPEGTEVNRTT